MTRLKADASHRAVWARAALFAALFFVAMVAGILLTRVGAQVSPVWIASAVLAWALLGAPTRQWPTYLAFTAVAHVTGAAVVGDAPAVEAIYLAADFAGPLTLVSLMRWRGDALAFEDRAETLRFLLIGGVLAPAVSASIVALGAVAGAYALDPRSVMTWFIATGLGFVVVLPLITVVTRNGWKTLLTPGTRRRTVSRFAILIAAFAVAWFLPASGYRLFMMLLIPYLIYIAFDVGLTAARAALALSALLVMVYALFGPTPADRTMEQRDLLLVMQIYVAVMVACVLPIASALAERQRLHETASDALNDAQTAWAGVIAAEARYRLIADNASELVLLLGPTGALKFASPAWRRLFPDPENFTGPDLGALIHPDDIERGRAELNTLVAAASVDTPRTWRIRLRDMNGVWSWYDVHASLVSPEEGEAGEVVAVLRQVQG